MIDLDGIFSGVTILFHGRKRNPLVTKEVTGAGGLVSQQLTDSVTHIIVGNNQNPRAPPSGDALMVSTQWVTDSVSNNKLLPVNDYLIFPEQITARKRKLEPPQTNDQNPVSSFLLHVAHSKAPVPIPAGLKREHLDIATQIRNSETAVNKAEAIQMIVGQSHTIESARWAFLCQEANSWCCNGIQRFLCDAKCALEVPRDSFPITHFKSSIADRAGDITSPEEHSDIGVVDVSEYTEAQPSKMFACGKDQFRPLLEPLTRTVYWNPKLEDVFLFKSLPQSSRFTDRARSLPGTIDDIARSNFRVMWITVKKHSVLATFQHGVQTPVTAYASPLKALEGLVDESGVVLLLVSVISANRVSERSIAVPSMSLLKLQLSEIQKEDIKSASQQSRIAHLEAVIEETKPSPFAANNALEDKLFSLLAPTPSVVVEDPSSILIHYVYSVKFEM
eukprot:TRINITY_DN19206_c0_g1_i1.p1 TRINITY_DN19206_c0_g1~~TRINITY_DN19206_c0_g1_i1.p1  ORF type:complete len:448 (+),score=66.99 TRINITY_DN19206_c0_g1_i1:34-1377(+)